MEFPPFIRLAWDEAPPPAFRGGAVAVGNFDGVHRGHASLIKVLRQHTRGNWDPAVVVSFDPHPLQLLAPEKFQPLLTTPAVRAELLQQAGASTVVLFRTSPELLHLTPDEFFDRILRRGFEARA